MTSSALPFFGRADHRQLLGGVALIAAALLLLRYLKFYRLYTMRVYVSFAVDRLHPHAQE
jgi:hypothetical protein